MKVADKLAVVERYSYLIVKNDLWTCGQAESETMEPPSDRSNLWETATGRFAEIFGNCA